MLQRERGGVTERVGGLQRERECYRERGSVIELAFLAPKVTYTEFYLVTIVLGLD